MWKCPKCNEIIEELYFQCDTTGWESGSVTLSKEKKEDRHERLEDFDYSDSGNNDSENYVYTCQECDAEISPMDLIWTTEEEDEKKHCKKCKKHNEFCICNEPEETKFNIVSPKHANIINKTDQVKDSSTSTIICKKCKYVFVAFGGETNWNSYDFQKDKSCECPKCRTSNSIEEFKKLLESNFFYKKKIRKPKYDRKKITN